MMRRTKHVNYWLGTRYTVEQLFGLEHEGWDAEWFAVFDALVDALWSEGEA